MPALPPDTSLQLPEVTVLRASAGSGKTYTLTERYAQFLLSSRIPHNDLRNILAITFSNNAAREMRGEVLAWLKSVALGDPARVEAICEVTAGGERELRGRAGQLVEAILTRWSDFQVRTIDSFMAAVFRASAVDFGYGHDLEILMEPDELTAYSFALFLRDAREGSEAADILDRTVSAVLSMQAGTGPFLWDPAAELLGKLVELEALLSGLDAPLSSQDFEGEMPAVEAGLRDALEGLRGTVERSGLTPNGRSTFPAVLEAVREGRFSDLINRGMKTPPVRKPGKGEEGLADAYERITAAWEEVDAMVGRYAGLWSRAFFAPYLRLHGNLSRFAEKARRSSASVAIGDIARLLAGYLDRDIVPDVYFRLGETVYHYLIDEFQDTSPVQWKDLQPLLENSLSQGGSLFVVGDTKQAIYAFRRADYRIMRGLESSNPFPMAGHRAPELDVNRRSSPRILAYVDAVFKGNAAGNPEYRNAARRTGLDSYTQKAAPDRPPGHVEVEILEADEDDPPEKARIQAVVRELHARGYRYGDIALLASRNDDVVQATAWLNEAAVPFVSLSSLDVRKRRAAGEVLALLGFLDTPPDDLAFATFILGELFTAVLARDGGGTDAPGDGGFHRFLFTAERPLYKAFQRDFPAMWNRYFSSLFRSAGYLPLYDLLFEALVTLGAFSALPEEEATFAKLLEAAKDFEGTGSNSLGDFLSFASEEGGEASRWSIDVPEGADCVRAMTIHKSKGLGFPVTIVLLRGGQAHGIGPVTEETPDGVNLLRITAKAADRDRGLAELYTEASIGEKVSRLNALYVALTRAKTELYVIGVRGSRNGFPFDLIDVPGYAPGPERGPAAPEPRPPVDPAPLSHNARGAMPGFGGGSLGMAERERGDLVHRILSRITEAGAGLAGRIEREAEAAFAEARRPFREPGLVEAIVGIVEMQPLAELLAAAPGRAVFTEAEFCDGAGRLFRMDLVVVDPTRVAVVDWKTGADGDATVEHESQVRGYLRLLGGVYLGRRLEGLLAYIDRGELREVT